MVGLALDAEGIAPAKIYYDQFGVEFPALVDPDYATQFGAVPKTFFIDECGVVLNAENWERQLNELGELRPVTSEVRSQWSDSRVRLNPAAIAGLIEKNKRHSDDLESATELASRYLALDLRAEARSVLDRAVRHYDARTVARTGGRHAELLGQAYFQLARANQDDREQQVRNATLSYYLNPSVGFGKQIARMIAPEKFDGRPDGDFDNEFREGTLRRLRKQRSAWLDSN